MWMVVFVANEDAFTRATHAMVGIVLLEAFQTGDDGRIFFRLCFLDAECVVGERVEGDFGRLLGIEIQGDRGWLGRLQCRRRYRGHCRRMVEGSFFVAERVGSDEAGLGWAERQCRPAQQVVKKSKGFGVSGAVVVFFHALKLEQAL